MLDPGLTYENFCGIIPTKGSDYICAERCISVLYYQGFTASTGEVTSAMRMDRLSSPSRLYSSVRVLSSVKTVYIDQGVSSP